MITRSITALICSMSLTTNSSWADFNDLVVVKGNTRQIGDQFVSDLNGKKSDLDTIDPCGEAAQLLFVEFFGQNPVIADILIDTYEAIKDDKKKELADSLLDSCNDSIDGDFTILYTTCSMVMFRGSLEFPTQFLRWTVPPQSPETVMVVLGADGKGMKLALESSLEELDKQGNTGKMVDANVDSLNRSKIFSLDSGEYEAAQYEYDYVGRMGPLMEAQSQDLVTTTNFSLDLIQVKSKGTAWIAPDAPGLDVIRTFYQNFERYVATAAGEGSLMGGMIEQMSALIDHGLPLSGRQTSTVGVDLQGSQGVTMAPFLNASSGMYGGVESSSESTIAGVWTVPNYGWDICGPIVIPDVFEITDLNQAIAGASAQSSSGNPATVQGTAGMEQALQATASAMEQMTPEERAMMEQMGLATATTGNTGAGVTGVGSAGVTATTGTVATSSAVRTSGDVVQFAQSHLQALGYEPGNTDGALDTMTQVAVSQFQAEQGLAVTGEVTPQLVGILAAEVER